MLWATRGAAVEPCRGSQQDRETNVVGADKTVLASSSFTPLCSPLEFWSFIYLLKGYFKTT